MPTPTVTPTPSATPRSACPGDCDGNGSVGINELIVGVNIALNTQPASACPPFDINRDAAVEIQELVACVNVALNGCSASPAIAMTVVNQMPIPAPCMGASLTFFEGTTPIDIAFQSQKVVQVAQLFGAYQIGFQVNGWYWRTCTAAGNCPNPNNCQNPDNAGQVAVEIAGDCSTATLIQNFSTFTCDSLVPNASQAVSVTLQASSPCTVVVAPTSTMLTPTDQCCSCGSCTGGEIPPGQVPHCQ